MSENLINTIFNLIKRKKYNEALKLLNNFSDKDPNSNLVYKMKGLIYLNKKDWKNSLLNYQKIPIKNVNFEISNNMGVALYKLGKFSEASIKFQDAISYNNSYLSAYENFCTTNKLLGNYNLAIKFSVKALSLFPTSNKIKNSLIDTLNYTQPKNCESLILQANEQILKLNSENTNNEYIKISTLNKLLNKANEIVEKNNLIFNYPHTQIFKKNKTNYECERHLQIFSEHKIIPKFCFNCYKVQITLNNVLELLRLYFYFNNLNLMQDNIRKCIVELRNNVQGNYKGYIFCKSIAQAQKIREIIQNDINKNDINVKQIEIKHGCTEYYEEFELYKNIEENVESRIYLDEWNDIEKAYDKKNLTLENNIERVFNNTLKLFNLPDFLIIRNWLIYAKVLGDNSYEKIINFNLDINKLSRFEFQKIISRKKY